jgi:hypothetical protein
LLSWLIEPALRVKPESRAPLFAARFADLMMVAAGGAEGEH